VPEDNRITGEMPNPPGLGPEVPRTAEQYAFEVTDRLQSQWLPLPYPVSAITTSDGDWRYHSETLDVVATDRDTRNLRYDVTAVVIEPTPDQLAGLPPIPGRFIDLLDLPENLPPLVRELANEVTEGAGDGYERAVALQQWFVYDLSIDPGNGTDDLVAFLEGRRGYCEQFAASMAIMARVLGIPARVAVGYLRGEETQPGFWVVRAQDAHAWPELYFDGIGWVRFEPTPGLRTGPAPDYSRPDATSEVPDSLQNPVDATAPDTEPGGVAPLDSPVEQGGAAGATPSRLPLLAAVLALVLLAVVPVLAGVLARRRRWGRVGDDPRLAAEAAWAEVQDAAWEVGHPSNPAQTVRVAADDLSATAGLSDVARTRLVAVARATERARFAARPPDIETLREDAAQVRQEFLALAPRRTRWSARLWPAPARRLARRLLGRR
jgi:transglutaminase-like putative cysteine protease